MPALGNAGGGAHHTAWASPEHATLRPTNEGYIDGNASWMLCDIDNNIVFVVSKHNDGYIYRITPGSGDGINDRVNVTPDDWYIGSNEVFDGFDRDAARGFAVINDRYRVYSSSGGKFAEVFNSSSLADPGRVRHCSCYSGNTKQLFVALDSWDGDSDLLWTRNGGDTWISRLGNLNTGDNYYEIRVAWMQAYG